MIISGSGVPTVHLEFQASIILMKTLQFKPVISLSELVNIFRPLNLMYGNHTFTLQEIKHQLLS